MAAPFSKNESGAIAAGAVSRPSIVFTSPPAVRITMNPPPPMPAENGSVTPSTPAAATVASIAFPPLRSVRIAAAVASRSMVAAAPPLPTAVAVAPLPAAGAASASVSAIPATAIAAALPIIALFVPAFGDLDAKGPPLAGLS